MITRGRRRNRLKFSERLTIMITPDLRKALETQAIEHDRSIGEVARKVLIEQFLPQEGEKA